MSSGIVELTSPLLDEGIAPGAAIFGKAVFGRSMFGFRIITGSLVITSRMSDIVELTATISDTVDLDSSFNYDVAELTSSLNDDVVTYR